MQTDALSLWLEHHLAEGHCPGALVHVERGSEVLARQAAGHVRPGDAEPMHFGARFRIASLTKPMVSLAALMLAEEGRLTLDEPVATYLPELAALRRPGGVAPQRAPTVRDLLRHTAGLPYPNEIGAEGVRTAWLQAGLNPGTAGMDAKAFIERIATLPLAAEPGMVFQYGYATDVLGCVLEALEGAPLATVLQRRLFGPLGMLDTNFEVGPADAPRLAAAHAADKAWHAVIPPMGQRRPGEPWLDSGGGGLLSTLDDTARFARLLAHGGVLEGRRLLGEAAFAEFARNQLGEEVVGPGSYTGPGFGFGLGMAVRLGFGPSAMPCTTGELAWSGVSGTALFVQPKTHWFALLFSANMASRMMARMAFRRAAPV